MTTTDHHSSNELLHKTMTAVIELTWRMYPPKPKKRKGLSVADVLLIQSMEAEMETYDNLLGMEGNEDMHDHYETMIATLIDAIATVRGGLE